MPVITNAATQRSYTSQSVILNLFQDPATEPPTLRHSRICDINFGGNPVNYWILWSSQGMTTERDCKVWVVQIQLLKIRS
jgi:hypothetical protein